MKKDSLLLISDHEPVMHSVRFICSPDPLDEHVEVLTGNDDQPFTWKLTKGMERIIVLLVPELPDAEFLVVLKTGSDEKSTPVKIAHFLFK